MKVASILRSKGPAVITTRPDTTISTIVWEFRSRAIGALVVSEDDVTPLGVVSERDVVFGLAEHGPRLLVMTAGQVMSRPLVTCTPDDTIAMVMAQMTRRRVRHLPVVQQGRLCGIVSIGDVLKHRLDELELEANVLRDALITSH